ncbi:MAG: hypothetical protein AUK44_03015 [Porphyromonadaceae bacterium CG2_30_38_12]|nr:MAG: hypothetical protein AUK44_03015 [Porphyromonadaceae bacterium CG2_30_38_12]
MVEIIIKGIIIGLFVSVPLGPIGMLCIQRTLNRGQKYGIFTGLGATTSDLLYTILSLFFLSFVTEFIEQYRFSIQFGGSIILLVFGYIIYKSHPSAQPQPNEKPQYSLAGDYITAFGLTLSNPLVLFILIALFAKFEFISSTSTIAVIAVGILSILSGALLWWVILTLLVSRFKSKLNLRGLQTINKITGAIIGLIGLLGIALSIA